MTSLRDELRKELPAWGVRLDPDFHDDTSLVVAGRLDSVGLFQLLLWIEEKIGGTLDAASLDLRREWDSVAAILAFVERRRHQSGGGDP